MSTSVLAVRPHRARVRGRSSLAVLHTSASTSQTLLRLTLGGVLLPHGGQHLLGLFGGYGFQGTLQWMTGTLGFPAPLAATAIVVEAVAPIALILGLGSRIAAALLGAFMATAAATHTPNGFFMNWAAALPAGYEGFEYHLLAIAMAVAIVARGGGAFSMDRLLSGGAQ